MLGCVGSRAKSLEELTHSIFSLPGLSLWHRVCLGSSWLYCDLCSIHTHCNSMEVTLSIFLAPLLYQPLQGKKKDWDALVQWASESSFSLVPLLTVLVLWASCKELKVKQVCYIACPEKCAEEYVLNVYLSFGWVNTNSHLSHRQNNLSRMSGHRVFRTLLC